MPFASRTSTRRASRPPRPRCASRGLDATALRLDVTSAADIDAAIAALEPDGPELLVNNAGLQHVAPLEDFPRERWELLVAVMLTGAAMLTRAVLPGMRRRGFGRIVNLGSIHSLVASPYKSAYVAAKHGLIGFAQDDRARDGRHRHHGQHGVPELRAHAARGRADRVPGPGARAARAAGRR